jgi:alpha-beta hydrolase superfamily lysophospholipase
MGSFLARTYIIRFPDTPLKGVILSATGRKPMPEIAIGIVLCNAEIAKHGPRFRSKKIDYTATRSNNNSFEPRRTEFDWLSRDATIVDSYVADPLCGFMPTVGLYKDIAGGLAYISKKKNLAKMNYDLPVLFMSGKLDPIGGNGAGVKKVYKMFLAAGMKDVFCKFYAEGRHEMLNEKNKDEVYRDILDWIQKKISRNETT